MAEEKKGFFKRLVAGLTTLVSVNLIDSKLED